MLDERAPRAGHLARMFALAVVYAGAAKVGLTLASVHQAVSPVWPATGVALTAMLILGQRSWPAIFAGALAGNLLGGVTPHTAALIAVGNTLEALLGAAIIRSIRAKSPSMGSFAEPLAIGAAAFLAPAASALNGTVVLAACGEIGARSIPPVLGTWWLGDALGALVLVPAILAVAQPPASEVPERGTAAELATAIAGAAALTTLVFIHPRAHPLLFSVFPLILFAAIHLGQRGSTLTALAVCTAAVTITASGQGPFVGETLNASLVQLQLFLASVALTGSFLGAVRPRPSLAIPGMILIMGWAGGAWLHGSFTRVQEARDAVHHERLAEAAKQRLTTRLARYTDVLLGGAALQTSAEKVTRPEWRRYVHDVAGRDIGLVAMAVVRPVPAAEADAFVARERADGAPQFTLHTYPGRRSHEDLFVIEKVAPYEGNENLLGVDTGSDPTRRVLLEEARDAGVPGLSPHMPLLRSDLRVRGFALVVPFYRDSAKLVDVSARRAEHLGWIAGVFVADDLFEELAGPSGEIAVRVRDAQGKLLFDGTHDCWGPEHVDNFEAAGQSFTLGWRRTAAFASARDASGAFVGGGTALLALLLAGLVFSLQTSERRAREMALQLTRELRASQERFELAVRGSHDGIWDWNVQANELYYSPRFLAILDYAPGDLPVTGMGFVSIVHPDDLPRVSQAAQAHLISDEVFDIDVRLETGRGEWRWVRGRGQAVRDEDGRPIRMAGSITDVTASRAAEESLRESEAKFRAISEASPAGLFVAGPGGDFTYVNEAWQAIVGATEQEAVGDGWRASLHPEDRDEVVRAWEAAVRGGVAYASDHRYVQRGGRISHAHVEAAPVRVGDRLVGHVGVVVDLRERLLIEDELRRARDAALDAVRARSEFLANMSHEIITPINGVIGVASLLDALELTEEQREYVDTIRASGEALRELVDDILDFSRIEARKLELEAIPFSLGDVLDEAVRIVSPRAKDRGLVLSWHMEDGVPDALIGDPARVRQVLLNLMTNAVKFTEHGSVKVLVSQTSSSEGASELRFSVQDTGIGVPEDKRKKIFEAFTQADGSMSRRYGGVGLGLAISSQLAHLMGGKIELESAEGRGSTFHVSLRFGIGAAPAVEDASVTPTAAAGPLRVLVAEDNPVNRLVVERLLGRRGHVVTSVADGLAAVERARAEEFDVALMDVQMPGMDGFEATAEIRKDDARRGKRLPIVALTAHALRGFDEKCTSAGMDAYLAKPVDADKLFAMVEGFAPCAPMPRSTPSLAAPRISLAVFDRTFALEQAGDDEAVLAEVLLLLEKEIDLGTAAIEKSLGTGDARGVAMAAHRLKGSFASIGAKRAADAAKRLEQAGRDGALDRVPVLCDALKREIDALQPALVTM